MTPIEALKQSVHCIRWHPGDAEKWLVCHRCQRRMHESQFTPLRPTNALRYIRGDGPAGSGGYVQYLHPWCHTCKKQSYGEQVAHPAYTPEIDRYWQYRMNSIKSGARKRGIAVLVEKDDFLRICLDQGNRCAITRLPMTFETKPTGENARTQASADRIDSRWNYTIDNIQIVCSVVNAMKNDMQTHEFMRWCALILDGRRKAESELLDAVELAP